MGGTSLGLFLFVTAISTVSAHQFSHRCIFFNTTVRCMHVHLENILPVATNTTLLDLRFNKIKAIRHGDLSALRNLETLMLSDNHIQKLHNGVFKGLSKLRNLALYKNRIREIEEKAFDGMPKLEQLYLHMNRIEYLHPHLFDKLQNLERLFLHENRIQKIEAGTFSGLRSLSRLRLDGNALVCDCDILWLKKKFHDSNMVIAATCSQPTYMEGKSVAEMDVNDFSCKEPRILEHPRDIVVSFGGPAEFSCRVDGDPTPEVKWMHNSNEINMRDPRIAIMDDGTLKINSVKEGDLGIYECMAKSPFGEIKSRPAKTLQSNTLSAGLWLRKPVDQVSTKGDTIQLECQVVDRDSRVTWTRDDIPLEQGIRRKISREGTLTIYNVTQEDAGVYRCSVLTPFRRLQAFANVTINTPPRFIYPPENIRALSGRTFELRCDVSGFPHPTITWFKDGSTVQISDRIQLEDKGSILRVSDAVSEDSGFYTCLAQNTVGRIEGSGEVRIRGLGPPTLILTPFPQLAPIGSSVELPCRAEGEPLPNIIWFLNGRPLVLDSHHKVFPVGSLRIYNVKLNDAGLYKCVASNVHGNISAEAVLRIGGGVNIEDNLVIQALEEARVAVDRAVNSTIEKLFLNRSDNSPTSIMRLLRYPDANTRTFVRAADVYEKTLLNIRRHISSGLHLNDTQDFSYQDLLTEDQLRLISRLSGCEEHQVTPNCSDLWFHTKYRTIDGSCNNFQHPHWGASYTGFRRLLKPVYENGFSTPVGWSNEPLYYGYPKPAARTVSTTLIKTDEITEDSEITHMVMQWGQFLDHDLDHAIPSTTAESWEGLDCKKTCQFSPPCFPIEVPRGDPRIHNRRCMDFIRSSAICGSGMTSVFFDKIHPREQINQLTAFIDGSQVYGFTDNRSILLRDYSSPAGQLRVGLEVLPGKFLLPQAGEQEVDCRRDPTESEIGCLLAGDIRANEQSGLLAMHTLWMREHNRIAQGLFEINPHWNSDVIFQEAKKIIGAFMQHITYEHWLPHILGPKGMEMMGKYEGYDPNVDPSISNVFATAALRFGHSLINPILTRLDANFRTITQGNLSLADSFFSPWRVVDEGGIDPLLRGLFVSPAKRKRPRQGLNSHLTERLFEPAHAVPLDLAAMNVQRGRDHGLPSYTDYRARCGLPYVETFDDLKQHISDQDVRDKLLELYGHPGNIDIWVGGILEDQLEGAKVGPTFQCLLIEQFKRIRDGDRFWYEAAGAFTPAQVTQLKQSSLAAIICDSGDNITRISQDVFILPSRQNRGLVDCQGIPRVDLRFWYDCEDCGGGGTMSSRERRELDVEAMETRVGGLEGIVEELQKTVRSLKRRMKLMQRPCKDARGRLRKDGETWIRDRCTFCECQGRNVMCTKLKCGVLQCKNPIQDPNKCCPRCP